MKHHPVLVGAIAAALLSLGTAGAATAGSKAQAINPECVNKYAVCPPKLKANEKPDWVPLKPVRTNKAVQDRTKKVPQRRQAN